MSNQNKTIAILSNKLYVPSNSFFPYVLDKFTYRIENKNKDRCDHCFAETCDDCPFANQDPYLRTYETIGQWTAFQRGDLKKIWESFPAKEYQIIDQRMIAPFEFDLKFTGMNGEGFEALWENQLEALKVWWQYRHGILKAPVRSGKTVIMTAMSMLLKQKGLLLCHTDDLLKQFLDTFEKFTNVIALRKQTRMPIIGICKDLRQWRNYDIVLSTPHSLYSKKGKAQIQDWRDYFGCVMADEIHRSAAHAFNKVMNSFNPIHRLGCTATELRKDQMEPSVFDTMGPVIYEMTSNQLPCKVCVWKTGYNVPSFFNFTTYQNRLVASKSRNNLILQKILERCEQGHSILAVTIRVEHVEELVRRINNAGYTAAAFHGQVPDRDKVLKDARAGKVQVVVGMRQMVREGINVPRWSNVHILAPIGFKDNAYQEYSRCRTRILPSDNVTDGFGSMKLQGEMPIIDYYLDDQGPTWPLFNTIKKSWDEQGFEIEYKQDVPVKTGKDKGRLRF